jgi:hypothetical protein
MKDLLIKSTAQTPFIYLQGGDGEMEIKGRSIPEKADEFWAPILNWFQAYEMNPSDSTCVKINLEYFNVSTSRRLLNLLNILNDITRKGKKVTVKWFYKKDDVDMYDVGQDYSYILHLPFEFNEVND